MASIKPTFDQVDITSWDSNWNEEWNEKADVYEKTNPKHSPSAIQDDVEWDTESDSTPASPGTASLPNAATLKKMKKPVLVQLAKLRKVSSSGTKADIIARLLA
tara:strand:+ start:108 stop:419 length:312 start_codon:yes stop_codon:yes gene_type:complete